MRRCALVLSIALGACTTRAPVPIEQRVVHVDAAAPACGVSGAAEDGDPCRCSGDCRAGAFCFTEAESGAPGGECVRICLGDEDCEPGWRCGAPDAGGARACQRTCAPGEGTCPLGRACENGLCFALCSGDDECDAGRCDPWTARCTTRELGGRGALASCVSGLDCRSRYCNAAEDRCITPCSLSRDHCPEGHVCISVSSSSEVGACAPRCRHDYECGGDGLACVLGPALGRTELVCLPEDPGVLR